MSAPQQALLFASAAGAGAPADPFRSYKVLHLSCAGANGSTSFVDLSPSNHVVTTNGNAQITAAASKFGAGSLACDGAGDWLQTTMALTDFAFGTGDFTVECWVKTTYTRPALIDFYKTGLIGSWQLVIGFISSGKLEWISNNGSATVIATGTSNVSDGAWHHVAACRSGATLRLFVDGVMQASVADPRNYTGGTETLAVGAQVAQRNAIYDMLGSINDAIVYKGAALYPAAFSVPTAPRAP